MVVGVDVHIDLVTSWPENAIEPQCELCSILDGFLPGRQSEMLLLRVIHPDKYVSKLLGQAM